MKPGSSASPRPAGGWSKLSGDFRFQLLVLCALVFVNAFLFFAFDFTGALERRDQDAPQYTQNMQNLLLHHETNLRWPQFRFLVPALSIGLSAVLGTSFRYSMQVLSALFMLLLVVFFFRSSRLDRRRAFYASLLFLSFPVVMVYSYTYFLEMPFLAALTISLWLWDRFINTRKISTYVLVMLCSVAGMLIKESFLIHLVVMGFYLAIFHTKSVRALFPYYLGLFVLMVGLYYFNYTFLFSLYKPWIIQGPADSPITILFHPFDRADILHYLSLGRGGLAHAVANLLLAMGAASLLVLRLWLKEKSKLRMILFGAVLFAAYVFVTFNIATEQRYVLMCFAPSYLLLTAKRVRQLEGMPRLPLILGAMYLVNAAAIVAYSIMQHHV